MALKMEYRKEGGQMRVFAVDENQIIVGWAPADTKAAAEKWFNEYAPKYEAQAEKNRAEDAETAKAEAEAAKENE